MIRYAYDLYPRTNPKNGARIVRFTQLLKAEWNAEASWCGTGFLVIPADADECDHIDPLGLQYIRVVEIDEDTADGATLSGFAERVVFGFFLENGDFKALDERNSKELTFGGAGTLSYLQRAIIADQTYISGAEGPYDDTWHWFYSTPGAILERMVAEAQEPSRPQDPIPDVTCTFDVLTDSDGNSWGSLWDHWLFEARVGGNLLDLAKRLMEHNLYVEMDPDTWELNAWDADTHRRDRTGASWGTSVIRFQSPTDGTLATGNILADASRALAAFIKRSDMLVGDKGVYSWVAGTSDIDWEGYYPTTDETDDSHATIGTAQLTARADAANTVRLKGIIGKSPGTGQYRPLHADGVLLDDLVTLHTGSGQWDFNNDQFPVAGIGGMLRSGGDWDIFYDLGAAYTTMAERAFQAQGVPHHHHPPNPELCRTGSLTEEWVDTGWMTNGDFEDNENTDQNIDPDWNHIITGTSDPYEGTYHGVQSGGDVYHNFSGGRTFVAGIRYRVRARYESDGIGNAGQWWLGDPGGRWDDAAFGEPLGSWVDYAYIDYRTTADTTYVERIIEWTPSATRTNVAFYIQGLHDRLDAAVLERFDSVSGDSGDLPLPTVRQGEESVGTSIRASRCDHEHGHGLLSDSGTHYHSLNQLEGATGGSTSTVTDHGSMGSTEEFNFTAGADHEGTQDANLTVTLSGATAGEAAWMTLVLSNAGYSVLLPASVVNRAAIEAAWDDSLNILTLVSYDGGTTWYGALSGSAAAVNPSGRWEPVVFDPGSGPEIVYSGGDIVMHFVED